MLICSHHQVNSYRCLLVAPSEPAAAADAAIARNPSLSVCMCMCVRVCMSRARFRQSRHGRQLLVQVPLCACALCLREGLKKEQPEETRKNNSQFCINIIENKNSRTLARDEGIMRKRSVALICTQHTFTETAVGKCRPVGFAVCGGKRFIHTTRAIITSDTKSVGSAGGISGLRFEFGKFWQRRSMTFLVSFETFVKRRYCFYEIWVNCSDTFS